jgi:GTP-dependent phosphoenolpyruvate carboxykinase
MVKEIENLGPKQIENLLFFLSRTGPSSPEIIGNVFRRIDDQNWINSGEFSDLLMLVRILNSNRHVDPVGLYSKVENQLMQNLFVNNKDVPPAALMEIICLHAREFKSSAYPFENFNEQFLIYIKTHLEIIEQLSF